MCSPSAFGTRARFLFLSTPLRALSNPVSDSVQPDGPGQHLLLSEVRLELRHALPERRDGRRLALQHLGEPLDVHVDGGPGFIHLGQETHLAFHEFHRRLDLRAVRANIERLHAENPEGAVVIQADTDSRTGLLVRVMDQIRLAGVSNISIAAEQGGGSGS